MKKYAILVIVIVAAFSTLSATFDSFNPGQQELPIMLDQDSRDGFFDHQNGSGCLYEKGMGEV